MLSALAASAALDEPLLQRAPPSPQLQRRAAPPPEASSALSRYFFLYMWRVFTRAQLLQEIWGYDYFGGTRTVDVHIRRLRSKLGPEFESIIGTVRNVGYRFTVQNAGREAASELV